jgi:glucosyl-dolichyl phosphate glucuronosyltransferase
MGPSGKIRISAIIATYNREKYIPGVLKSLQKQSLDKDLFEIIIIDNNCTDNTRSICQDFIQTHTEFHTRYISEPRQGLSFGRNCGITYSTAELLTFVDDDACLSEDFLKTCTEFFENNPSVDAIGGRILLKYEGEKPSWVSVYHESLFGYFNPGDKVKTFESNKYPRGSNMTFRKKVFTEYGLFNTNLGRIGADLLGSEEKELFDRLGRETGKVVYVPEAVVYHYVPVARTKKDFIRKQAIGIGKSEKIRTISKSKLLYFKRIFQEIIKWGGTSILFLIYALKLEMNKAGMIVFLRFYITVGLL